MDSNKCENVLRICQEYMVSLPDCANIPRISGREALVHGGVNFIDLHVLFAVLDQDKINLVGAGDSMKPFFMSGERLCIEKKSEFCEKDIVLFIQNRKLIAHRVCGIKKQESILITKGDNRGELESVSFNDVIGVVAKYPTQGKTFVWLRAKDEVLKFFRNILAHQSTKAVLRFFKNTPFFRYYVCIYENPFSLQKSFNLSIEKSNNKYMVSGYFLTKNIANGELIKMPDYCEFDGWWFNNLFVHPSFRDMGVEEKLLAKLIDIAQKLDIDRIRFVPSNSNILAYLNKLAKVRNCQKWHELYF